MFKDMLKENGKWSQGRVYLFISVLVYFITLGVMMTVGFHKDSKGEDIDMDKYKIIIEALKYAMVLFGGYVFGGKFIDVMKIMTTNKKEDNSKQIL